MQYRIGIALPLTLFLLISGCKKPEPPTPTDTRYKKEHAEQVQKMINENLGNGYKGFEYYANKDSTLRALFDVSDPKQIEIVSAPSFKDRFASGETKTEYYDSFAGNVSVAGTYDGFSGEISSNFSNDTLRNRANSFATSHKTLSYYRLSLLESTPLLPEAVQDLAELEPQDLFKKYGTHFLKSFYIGGRVSFNSFVDRSKVSNNFNFKASVDASYLELVKGTGGVDIKNRNDVEIVSQNKEVDVFGGDPALANNVETGSGDPALTYNSWSESVPRFMSIADFADGGLIPIYELAATSERRSILENAWKIYMAENTSDVLKEAEPAAVKKNSSIKLKSEDGRFIGVAPYALTNDFYYPTIADKGIKLIFGGDSGTLKNGNNVTIKTSEKFKDSWGKPWSKRIYLGAFDLKTWLYYWDLYAAKTNWIFQKTIPSTDQSIRYGDSVYIKNEHYKDGKAYLAPTKDGYLTTQKEPYVWSIEK